jgi:hypothetical protein
LTVYLNGFLFDDFDDFCVENPGGMRAEKTNDALTAVREIGWDRYSSDFSFACPSQSLIESCDEMRIVQLEMHRIPGFVSVNDWSFTPFNVGHDVSIDPIPIFGESPTGLHFFLDTNL